MESPNEPNTIQCVRMANIEFSMNEHCHVYRHEQSIVAEV
jgi:hypothetical protein